MKPRILESAGDFHWYKKELDVANKYDHRHSGIPKRYPCAVRSLWGDDENGPYFFNHVFVYQQEVECPECHHKTLVWPESVSDESE